MTKPDSNQEIIDAATSQFPALKACHPAQRFGNGLINDTWLVTGTSGNRYILQRLNKTVFHAPELILENIRIFCNHLQQQQQTEPNRLVFPEIITTVTGSDYFTDPEGNCWRTMGFIENTISYDILPGATFATETGFALGYFHRVAYTIDTGIMHDTLPGFHIAPAYLAEYERRQAGDEKDLNARQDEWCNRFIQQRLSTFAVLEDAREKGEIHEHVIHGDPKLNNILFDKDSGKAVSIIDLDTLKPGLLHYDIGDCIRSCCNPAGENPDAAESTHLDMKNCELILTAWLQQMSPCLNDSDWHYLYDAIHLLPLELGTRFYTDHLAGDHYFRVDAHGQNLARAKTQFYLALDIENREAEIRRLIENVKARTSG